MISQKKIETVRTTNYFWCPVQLCWKNGKGLISCWLLVHMPVLQYIVCIHWPSGSTTCACHWPLICVPGSLALPLTSLLVCMHQPSPHLDSKLLSNLGIPHQNVDMGSGDDAHMSPSMSMMRHQLPWWQNNKLRCQNPNGTWHRDMMTSSMEEVSESDDDLEIKDGFDHRSVYAWLKLYIRQPR